jgi:CBS domain-containing protein
MAATARDLMQTRVVTVAPDAPLSSVQRVFVEEGIHGAPVVDEEGRVLGVITSMDLLRAAAEEADASPAEPAYFRYDLDLHGVDWSRAPADLRERLPDAVAADVMTAEILSVEPDTPVAGVARILREHSVHRVLVVEDGELRGILSAMDLLALLEAPA